ncbi:MAG TPA: NAD(P)/FAD-dependent oxidoreductase [Actinomycetales bacterium]|nr:NAD(P)/FAD-dependent oxidoreductase [Actinomycetales bacterium]
MASPTDERPSPAELRGRFDAVVVGGGHNGLTAAAYLARAGRSVLVLEQLDHVGGAAVSEQAFAGVPARLSRYSYLVSLLPRQVVDELGLPIRLVRRRYSSYTPVPGAPARGLLVDTADDEATARSFAAVTGSASDAHAWQRFYALTRQVAQAVFPTMTEPLRSSRQMRSLIGDEAWEAFVEHPLGQVLEQTFGDDTVRGVALTDGLIGTFAAAGSPTLQQNRCFLYHVIGGGTGDWDVPVGGMGAVTDALAAAATSAGARLVTSARVSAIDPDGAVTWTGRDGRERTTATTHVLAGCAPTTLARLLGEPAPEPGDDGHPEGAQLKVNMVLRRLPRLLEPDVDPAAAFGGTFHVNEGYAQLDRAHAEAETGRLPSVPPCEIYCHSLSDPSILGRELRAAGAQTLTLFGLHMPARLFREDNEAARGRALDATLRSLDSVLGEPIGDCLWTAPDGTPCLEVRTPVDLEESVGLPGGNIFHRDLAWPWAEHDADIGRWGVETEHPRVLLCGAGARRGGGVSGIPGRAAAMAVLAGGS